MKSLNVLATCFGALIISSGSLFAQNLAIQRTADGMPDFTGTFNAATLTPLERPKRFAGKVFLSAEEVQRITDEEQSLMKKGNARTEGARQAPAVGGAALVGFEDRRQEAERLGAGNVGGYNVFWFDRGETAFSINGKYRTSIITDPPNGRMPTKHPHAEAAFSQYSTNFMRNDGTAWWLGEEGPGPYDNLEQRPAAERCLLGFVEGPPTLPALYNNFIKIVQTADTVMIMNEMIHDARIVRMNGEHIGKEFRSWLGDSVGWWEGDTLVIETSNFRHETGLSGASRTLKVTERITALDRDHLQYAFTIDDPGIWTVPWSGDYVWARSDEHIYEYACHEGNYALGGIMRGARLLEAEAAQKLGANTQ